MSDIAINPVTRRVQFTGNTGTGPYAFTFNILVDGDIAVFKGTTELTLTTDYTVSINANGTGSITLTVALIASDVLTIIGGRELSRTTDFVTAGDLLASSLNEQLDSNVIMTQQLDEKLGRGLFVNPGDVFTDLELPLKDDRKGTVLGFNATTGDPEPGPEIADVDSLANISADIKTLAEIQDGTVATDAITNVNTIRANVTTVSSISGNVTTVAGISSDVTTVAADGADIGTVAGISSDVTTVSGISGNVTSVAGNASNINTVAADGADIGTVATSITNVNTVATDIANVNTNATNIASINTNATNITDIQNASANAASALSSKNAAATSATNSANSATASETSRVASVAAQAAAETAETNAETAQTAAETAETNAAASETAAATSETNASTSAATATTQAGIATTKAGEAAASATASATSASASEAAKDATLAALDNFDDRYLGAKASDPTLDNDGNALISGALYFNTTDDVMKVYDGSQWLAAYASLSGALLVNNNLSDVADAAASRTNLGLGTGNTPTFAGINTTGNATFGDNDKAIFGSGSDLEIFHNGSASVIKDAGVGDLYLAGSGSVKITNDAINEDMAVFNHNGSVDLYYDSAKKLATTSTGIDVTGTVTADGLTVDGSSLVNGSGTITSGGSAGIDTRLTLANTGNGGSGRGVALSLSPAGSSNSVESVNLIGLQESVSATANNSSFVAQVANSSGTLTQRLRINNGGDLSLYDSTGTTPKFFWDASAESLGIGTSSPSQKVTVGFADNGTDGISFRSSSYANLAKILAENESSSQNGNLQFYTRSGGDVNQVMHIGSSGNVGIGVVPVSSWDTFTALQIEGSSLGALGDNNTILGSNIYHDNNAFKYIGAAAATVYQQRLGEHRWSGAASGTAGNTANMTQHMTLDSSGNLLVGTTSGSDKVTVNGTVSATNFNTTSDATLKTNVETLTGSLDAVKSLRGVSFDWIENGNSEVGFIAQEVEEVVPEVVSTNDQGIKSVKYGNMVALLIEAMKEQQAQIDELKAKLGE